MQKLIKAEILWTRECNLRCSYCNMACKQGKIKKDWKLWKKGLDNLKTLGGDKFFTAVYGAEPLMDMEYLPEYFAYIKKLGFYHTLITNCSVPDTEYKLKELVNAGLNSLTVSFDGDGLDKSSEQKTRNALGTLEYFRSICDYRDLAVVFTLTRKNINAILDWIPVLSKMGIIVFFDLIHGDVGNPGTKCKNYIGIKDLLFQEEHKQELVDFFRKLSKMKHLKRYYIHQSYSFIRTMIVSPEAYLNRNWNCGEATHFPAWITVDYDGVVRPCDDFYVKGTKDWKLWELTENNFSEFSAYWKGLVRKYCKGCFWNTHWDALQIKAGVEKFENYVEGS